MARASTPGEGLADRGGGGGARGEIKIQSTRGPIFKKNVLLNLIICFQNANIQCHIIKNTISMTQRRQCPADAS